MNSERLALLFLCILVSACSTTPSRTAQSVRVATASIVEDCELLGEVTGSSSHAGIGRRIWIPRAKNEAREIAAAMGATHIIWTHIESW